ncbi:MAG: hypothetical protein AB1781_08255 [Pseudomonadota bacterium]
MKFVEKRPPREFEVGNAVRFPMRDCGTVALDPNEQVTLTTESGGEYDVARKEWGFYATPSLNGRLLNHGLRGVLIRNKLTGRYFVFLVESGKEPSFEEYMAQESLEVVAWLDSTESLDRLRRGIGNTE